MNLRDSARHLRAILVAVDYLGELSLSLPANLRHFKEVWVVTSYGDWATQDFVNAYARSLSTTSLMSRVNLHITNAFYEDGAHFNKFRAMEECLDVMGRHGWLCIMDADVIWPAVLPDFTLEVGKLYSPLRYMAPLAPTVPSESEWDRFPIHRNVAEFAGYSQLFSSADGHLGKPPWHATNFTHAGTADSLFQQKWPPSHKVRPPFRCLHMGSAGANWLGRATPRLDGSLPEGSAERQQALRDLIRRRVSGPTRFDAEKI